MAGFKNVENKVILDGMKTGRNMEDVAKELGRDIKVVARQALRLRNKDKKSTQQDIEGKPNTTLSVFVAVTPEDKVLKDLQNTPTYRELTRQLTGPELRFYEENYIDLIMQFGENDTTKSEKLQIHKAVEYLIFMGRNKNEQLETMKSIDKIKLKIKNFENANPNDENWDEDKQRYFSNMDEKLVSLNRRRSDLSKEYGELEKKNQELFNDLKATRTARLTSAEKRMSITDLVSELLNRDKRESVGRQAEMFKTFTDGHNAQLSKIHKFADGSKDPPILTPNVVLNNAEEIEKIKEEEKAQKALHQKEDKEVETAIKEAQNKDKVHVEKS